MRRPLTLLTLAALAACPSTKPPADGGVIDSGTPDASVDSGTPDAGHRPDASVDAGFLHVDITQWCQTQATAVCERDVRCGRISRNAFADCLPRRVDGCDQPAYTRAVREGRLQYLGPQAVQCLDAYGAGDCEEVPSACAAVFTGLTPADAGCILTEECDVGGFCYPYDNLCPHRCRAFLPRDAGCDGFTTRCNPADSACDLGPGGVNVCQAQHRDGEACVSYDSCQQGSICYSSQCVKQRAGPGEACGTISGYPYCSGEYFCRQGQDGGVFLPGTCQRRAGLGGACNGNHACLPSLRCTTVLTTGVCVPKSPQGDPCASYDDCQDGMYCSNVTDTCLPNPGDGGDCSYRTGSSYRCAPGNFCNIDPTGNDDRCLARRALGEDCNYDGICLSNECEFGTLPDAGFGGRCIVSCSQRADGGF